MRIISASFIFAGANIAFQGIFQALNAEAETLVISLGRQLVFILPDAYFLSRFVINSAMPGYIIWFTFPFGELATMLIGCAMLKAKYKNDITPKKLDF